MAIIRITTPSIADDAVDNTKLDLADDYTFTGTVTGTPTSPSFKNLIINGDMSIAQRGTSQASVGSTSGYYTLDRFEYGKAGSANDVFTMSQSTEVPTGQGFGKSLKMEVTTADASIGSNVQYSLRQRIEGQMLQHLKKGTSNAESITLSFWVKSNKTGTYIVTLDDKDNTRTTSKSYTINSASTWEKKTITYDPDTTGAFDNDNGASLDVRFLLGVGSNFNSGTLATTWESTTSANVAVGQVNFIDTIGNEWYITGVQLEVGTSASDFEFLPYDVNLQRCLRYFYGSSGSFNMQSLKGGDTSGAYLNIFYETMRTEPSLSNCSEATSSDLGINQGFIVTGTASTGVTSYNLDSEL